MKTIESLILFVFLFLGCLSTNIDTNSGMIGIKSKIAEVMTTYTKKMAPRDNKKQKMSQNSIKNVLHSMTLRAIKEKHSKKHYPIPVELLVHPKPQIPIKAYHLKYSEIHKPNPSVDYSQNQKNANSLELPNGSFGHFEFLHPEKYKIAPVNMMDKLFNTEASSDQHESIQQAMKEEIQSNPQSNENDIQMKEQSKDEEIPKYEENKQPEAIKEKRENEKIPPLTKEEIAYLKSPLRRHRLNNMDVVSPMQIKEADMIDTNVAQPSHEEANKDSKYVEKLGKVVRDEEERALESPIHDIRAGEEKNKVSQESKKVLTASMNENQSNSLENSEKSLSNTKVSISDFDFITPAAKIESKELGFGQDDNDSNFAKGVKFEDDDEGQKNLFASDEEVKPSDKKVEEKVEEEKENTESTNPENTTFGEVDNDKSSEDSKEADDEENGDIEDSKNKKNLLFFHQKPGKEEKKIITALRNGLKINKKVN